MNCFFILEKVTFCYTSRRLFVRNVFCTVKPLKVTFCPTHTNVFVYKSSDILGIYRKIYKKYRKSTQIECFFCFQDVLFTEIRMGYLAGFEPFAIFSFLRGSNCEGGEIRTISSTPYNRCKDNGGWMCTCNENWTKMIISQSKLNIIHV